MPTVKQLAGALRDPQFRQDVMTGLRDTAYRGAAGALGAPVDLATMAMRPFGYNVPAEQVVGGSEWLGQKMQGAGLVSGERNPSAEFLANFVTPDPSDVAKILPAMFIGPAAKAWKAENAAKAAKMELEGADPRQIWAETGTWKGPEGKWRQEIPDNELTRVYKDLEIINPKEYYQNEAKKFSKLKNNLTKEFKAGNVPRDEAMAEFAKLKDLQKAAEQEAEMYYSPGRVITKIGEDIPFEKTFKHEKLQQAYGELPTVAFNRNLPFEGEGSYSRGRIEASLFNKDKESVIAHELQHAIQEKEGFARGGNPEQFAGYDKEIASLADQVKTYDVAYFLKEKMQQGMDLSEAKKAYFDKHGIEVPAGAGSMAKYSDLESLANHKRDAVLKINELSDVAQYSPYEAYRRLAGEAEARATQARLNMTEAERRAKFPEESYDVPMSELIIRDQFGGPAMSTQQAAKGLDLVKQEAKTMSANDFLNQNVSDVLPAHIKTKTLPKVVVHENMPISSLTPSEYDEFEEILDSPKSAEKIKQIIGKEMPPILVKGTLEDNKYLPQVIDGHHRTMAAILEKKEQIPVSYDAETLAEIWKKQNNDPRSAKEIVKEFEKNIESRFSKEEKKPVQAPRDEAMRIAQANAAKPVSEGGLGLPANNTAMDRARAMGFDVPAYRGTTADETNLKPRTFISENPDVSNQYAGYLKDFADNPVMLDAMMKLTPSGNVMPLLVREADVARSRTNIPDYEMIVDANQARSRFAAFDPARRYESDLLGAADPRLLAGMALGGAGVAYKANQSQQPERKKVAKALRERE